MREEKAGAGWADRSTDERIVGGLRFCAHFLRHNTEGKGGQRRVLFLLRRHGPMTQRDLLERMGVRPSSASELLSKLEAKGCVVKEKSTEDKRNYNVSITPEGVRALEEMQRQYEASMADLLSGLEEAEKAQLAALLEKLGHLWRERDPAHGRGRGGEHG